MIVDAPDVIETMLFMADFYTERRKRGDKGAAGKLSAAVAVVGDPELLEALKAASAEGGDVANVPVEAPGTEVEPAGELPAAVGGETTGGDKAAEQVEAIASYLNGSDDVPIGDVVGVEVQAAVTVFEHAAEGPMFELAAGVPEPMAYADYLSYVDRLPEIDHISYSSNTVWRECPGRFVLDKLGPAVPERPAFWNLGGTLVHHMLATDASTVSWDYRWEELVRATEQDSGLGRDRFRAANKGKEGYDFWLVEGASYLERGKALMLGYLVDGWMITEREKRRDVSVVAGPAATMSLRVEPDMVLRKGCRVLVVDAKTGSAVPTSPLQLATYGMALIAEGSVPAHSDLYGEYWMLRRNTDPVRIALAENHIPIANHVYGEMANAILRKSAPLSPGSHCYRCIHKPTCPIGG